MCTGPHQPYYATQNQANPGQTMNCACNAEYRWPVLIAALSFLLTTNLSNLIFVNVLGTLQILAPAAGCPRTAHHI